MARKPPTYDVFVGNLPNDANEKNLGKFFTPFGEIAGIIVKETSKVPPPNNKFAFVKYLCEPDADKAVKELDQMKLQGSTIVVKRAENRPNEKKKNPGEGGRRNIKQQNEGGQEQGDWICPSPECGNSNFGWRNQCNKCSQKRPDNAAQNNAQDLDTASVGSGSFQNAGFGQRKNAEQDLQGDTVMITHVETPITVWIQVVNDENTKRIFHITEQLATLCPAANPLSSQPDMNKVYACLFTEDNLWYRCQVRQTLGTDKFKIQYIDYGNTEEVPLGSLVDLTPNLANIRPLATKVVLHNIRAKDLTDKQGIQFLKSLTDNQMARVVRTRALTDGSGHYGHVYVGTFNVADQMIQAGYCQNKPAMGRSAQPVRPQQNDVGMFQEPPGPQMMGQPMFPSGGGRQQKDRDTVSPFSQLQPMMGQPPFNQPPVSQPQIPNMGFPKQIGPPQDQTKKLQQQISKKNLEIEKIKNEKDAACIQAEYMRTKVKTLQDEFAASAAKLQEDTLSNRINTVVALAFVVRRLRDQFPTKTKPCLLVDMITACMDPERVETSKFGILNDVGSAIAIYKAAQKEISQCQKQGELEDLVKARDEARRELHRSLSSCLDEMGKLPLDERAKLVQELQSGLVNIYGDFLKFQLQEIPSLENLAPGFTTWKSKKDTEFQDVRTATDYCEGALQTALSYVKERISVEVLEVNEQSDVDIDGLFKTYAHALQREINVTDLVHGKDANFVATVIASIKKELQSEAGTIDNIRLLQREFRERKESIEPWLNESPALTELQENRKLLRSLKSKLRHTLADKLDLEESGDEGDLDRILEEEKNIRTELQSALAQSDSLMKEVAVLADSNFPELIVQYPDLGIDSYLLYKGLVKTNRDIDQYCLKQGFRPGVYFSTFIDRPVLIQEFHIGDSDHCTKDEFMSQLIGYHGDGSPIQAVFFSKNERLAYVECEWNDCELLETALKSRELSQGQLLDVSKDLASEVVRLHKRDFIHGEINPQSVIIREDNSITMLFPDFSKKVADRIAKKYVTEEGLVFQSPELQYSSPEILGSSADVYNLVLLIYWLYNPNKNSAGEGVNAVKDLNPLMQQLFESVLSGKTATRIHAEHVLQQVKDAVGHAQFEAARQAQAATPPSGQKVRGQTGVGQPSSNSKGIFKPISQQAPGPRAWSPVQWSSAPNQPQSVQGRIEPAIKSTDEPMEIGVFRAEDYMTSEQNILPVEPIHKTSSGDTDNSWTTESSASGTTDSRENSPLDTTVMEAGSQRTVLSDTDTLSEGLSELSNKLLNCPIVDNGDVQHTAENSEFVQTDILTSEQNSVNTSPASEQKGKQDLQESLGFSVAGIVDTPAVGVTEKGAACELSAKDSLKTLLNESKTFLTEKGRLSPLFRLLDMGRKHEQSE